MSRIVRSGVSRTGGSARLTVRLGALLAAAALAIFGPSVGSGAATPAHPVLVVSPTTAAPGTTVQVTGSGFAHKQLYQLQVCGNEAAQGSTDCDQVHATMALTTATGTFDTTLAVTVPPAPCPCVVAALGATNGSLVTAPLTIPGAPSEPAVTKPPVGKVVVKRVELVGGTQPSEWLGFGADRTLKVTVQNVGGLSMQPITLIASIGGSPVMVPQLPGLAPGQTRTYSLAVSFPALSVGHTELTGRIGVMGEQFAGFRTGISFYPWAIPVLAIVVGQGLLLLIRNLLRRRIRRRQRRALATGRRPAPVPASPPPHSVEGDAGPAEGLLATPAEPPG